MARTRIKICGVTRPRDARAAADAGADAIGLVFYPPSRRYMDTASARRVVAELPPFVAAVGLFMDADSEWVHEVLTEVPLSMLQFHGSESAQFCRSSGRPYIKGVGMADDVDLAERAATHGQAQGLLVDSHGAGEAGGTGTAFEWSRLPRARNFSVILAGGLGADNVASAIETIAPEAVDVSSGVESEAGVKDEALVQRFVEEVERGDRNRA